MPAMSSLHFLNAIFKASTDSSNERYPTGTRKTWLTGILGSTPLGNRFFWSVWAVPAIPVWNTGALKIDIEPSLIRLSSPGLSEESNTSIKPSIPFLLSLNSSTRFLTSFIEKSWTLSNSLPNHFLIGSSPMTR